MAQVNLVNKQVQMSLEEIIKFQLLTHCHINRINLSDLEFECLIYLGITGECELIEFCNAMADKRLQEKLKVWQSDPALPNRKQPESSPQTIRNILIKIEKENLLKKTGKGRKQISLNPDLKIQTQGNILLNYKMVHIGS